jgi:hypothetical protein
VKLIILDPDLMGFGGHNFNYLEGMVRHARSLGIATHVFAHRQCAPAVLQALGATPHFTTPGRAIITDVEGPDEVRIAWTHVVLNTMFGRDLVPLTRELGPDTVVFVPATTSRQTAALAEWLALIAPVSLPRLVCLLRFDIDNYPTEGDLLKVPIRVLATLKRPAVFCCETEENTEVYRATLGVPVQTMPLPFVVPAAKGTESARPHPAIVGYFGDARFMKGSHLLPGLCELAGHGDGSYRLCIQTFDAGAEAPVPAQIAAVRRAAVNYPDAIRFVEGPQKLDRYHRLLRDSDIVLLPHRAATYRRQTSAIFCEAVSAGKVVVMPDGSSMSTTMRLLGSDPITFQDWTVEGVQEALIRAVGELDARRAEAQHLARLWNERHGPKAIVNFLVAQHRAA